MDTIDEMLLPHVGWLAFEPGDEVATFLRQGWFEFAEQALLWLYGRPGDVVLDLGAHVGLFSATARQVVLPGGRIIAVEPAAATAHLLGRNTGGEVTIIQAAIGETTGRLTLHQAGSGRSAYNTLSGPVSQEDVRDVEVEVITLDQLLEQQGIDRADFVKLDVEGAELAAWRGAKQALDQRRLAVVMIEFTEPNLQRAGTSSEALFKAILDSGYAPCRFDPDSGQLVPTQFTEPIWYDNLFAVADLAAANARLNDASADRRRIAADIVARGQVGQAVREIPVLRERITELENIRDSAHAALEKVRHDLQEQIGLRDQSYAAHAKTAETLHQTQTWLKTTTQRAEQAEERLRAAQTLLAQREQQLLVFCTSSYEQFSWRIGLRKKPDWVDAFVAAHQPVDGDRAPGKANVMAGDNSLSDGDRRRQ